MNTFALELIKISKRFPGVVANDDATLRVQPGRVHALVGENGTGKTTLMRIASGMTLPDAGEVRIMGQALGRGGTRRALALGLGMVHQHFMLVPTLRVFENVVLGREPHRGPWIDQRAARAAVRTTAERFGLHADPDARIEDLSQGEQQRVEIIRVLERGARILILDEPTAVLTPREVEDLFAVLRRLAADGCAVVLISHRLQEVLAIADVVTVMRRGRVVAEISARDADEQQLAAAIVGRELESVPRRSYVQPGAVVLHCDNLHTTGHHDALRGVDLRLRAGEVFGVAGVEGNGQSALAAALIGIRRVERGRVELGGHDVTRSSPAARRSLGLRYVPADRLRDALVPAMRVDENAVLGQHRQQALGRGPLLSRRRLALAARRMMQRYDVRPGDPAAPAAALSGGNQQRLVLARELDGDPVLLVLAQPTRGVDVGGTAFIHQQILAARERGTAVLLISADLNEILTLSDRIVVFFEGRIAGTTTADQANAAQLGLWMTGAVEPSA